jgi:hypothetical protein
MLRSEVRRRWAALLMASSLVGDAVVVVALALDPRAGAVLASVLVLLYSAAAQGVAHSETRRSCRCFWKVMNTSTNESLLARNILMLGAAITVGIGGATASVGGILLAGPLLLGIAFTTWGADRVTERRRTSRSDRSERVVALSSSSPRHQRADVPPLLEGSTRWL